MWVVFYDILSVNKRSIVFKLSLVTTVVLIQLIYTDSYVAETVAKFDIFLLLCLTFSTKKLEIQSNIHRAK